MAYSVLEAGQTGYFDLTGTNKVVSAGTGTAPRDVIIAAGAADGTAQLGGDVVDDIALNRTTAGFTVRQDGTNLVLTDTTTNSNYTLTTGAALDQYTFNNGNLFFHAEGSSIVISNSNGDTQTLTNGGAATAITVNPGGGSQTTYDIDNKGNYVTGTQVTLDDLGTKAYNLTDSVTLPEYVRGQNYGADDNITFSGVTEATFVASALFSTDAAGDVRIIYTDPSTLAASVIQLDDIAGSSIVSSYQDFQNLAVGDIKFA